MSRTRKIALALLASIGLVLTLSYWRSYLPEPRHNNIGLNTYLTSTNFEYLAYTGYHPSAQLAKALDPKAATYLAKQMQPNAVYELAFRLAPKFPSAVQPLFPNKAEYQTRRLRASSILSMMRTNAAPALPTLLSLVEKRDPLIEHPCLMLVGTLAPGTTYEERALRMLLRLLEQPRPSSAYNHRKAIYSVLGNFTIRLDEISSVLVHGLREYSTVSPCLDSILKIGPPAIPALREAVKSETNIHVRPAGLALEKIEQAQKQRSQKQAGLSSL